MKKITYTCNRDTSYKFHGQLGPLMKEVRDNTSTRGGLPTLPNLSAKLNFNTYLQNRFLIFSAISLRDLNHMTVQKLVIYILLSLCGYMCLLRHTFTTSWRSKLRPNYNKTFTTKDTHFAIRVLNSLVGCREQQLRREQCI